MHKVSQTNDWKEAFAKRSAIAFADALADDVVLEAATLTYPACLKALRCGMRA